MFNKIYEWFYEIKTKTVSMDYIIEHNGSYSSVSSNGKWCFYWIGDFKTGKTVKVSKIEVLNKENDELRIKNYLLKEEIKTLKGEDRKPWYEREEEEEED